MKNNTDMKKLYDYFLSALVFLLIPAGLKAQSVTTDVISFKIEDVSELFMPPNLKVEMEFRDDNNTGILESLENARLYLKIKNEGGAADNIKVSIVPERDYPDVIINQNEYYTSVPKNSFVELDVPFFAGIDVETMNNVRFNINITEPFGFNSHSVLKFSTFEYQKASLRVNGVSIIDSGIGQVAHNGNPDGKLQIQDVVRTTVHLQNVGIGTASNVTYKITSKDENVRLLANSGYAQTIEGTLSDMVSADTRDISFRLSATANYLHRGEYLPVYLTVTEDKGFGNIESQNIPIPFDATPLKPEVVTVNADIDKMVAGLERAVIIQDQPVMNSTIRNIMAAPLGESIYSNAVAVVIGTEKYKDPNIPRAPYARRDAEVMAKYFKTSLGVSDVILLKDDEVTIGAMKNIFKWDELSRRIHPGVTDVFVYYSGHGVSMNTEDGGSDIYLLPYEFNKSYIRDSGFSLNQIYDKLSSLNARSVTVILDACFSGGSRISQKYKSESVANQKLVISDVSMMSQPWHDNPNFRVFASSRGDQTSQGYDLSESGLFTYYLAVGLQGDADADQNGTITMGELVEFVTHNVDKESKGAQTPQFHGNRDFIIEKIK